jgi:hypothetical protein
MSPLEKFVSDDKVIEEVAVGTKIKIDRCFISWGASSCGDYVEKCGVEYIYLVILWVFEELGYKYITNKN